MGVKEENQKGIRGFFDKYRYQLFLFLVIIAVKGVFNCFLSTLVQISGADEFGTIAGASFFAGLDWSNVVSHVSYYGFGYSMFMAPIFWLTDNPVVIFHFMIAFNSICLGLTGIIAYNMAVDIFKIKDQKFAVLTAFASAMYFGNVLNANAVYNESMLVLIGWLMVYILLLMQERVDAGKKTYALTVLLSLIMVYSLLVHTRALYLWGAAAIFILTYLVVKRKLLCNPLIIGGICAVGYVLSKITIEKVQNALWLVGEDKSGLNNSVESLGNYFANIKYLGTISGLKGFLYTIFGQIYGMITISGGLYAIFIAIALFVAGLIIYNLVKKEKIELNEKLLTLGMFVVSFLGAALLLTALGISDRTAKTVLTGQGSKWYLYARYWGMVGGLMIFVTLVFLYEKFKVGENAYGMGKKARRMILSIATGGFVFVSAVFVLKLAPKFYMAECSYSNVYLHYVPMGFLKKGDTMSQGAFLTMSIFALVSLAVLIVLVMKNKYIAVTVAVIVLALYNYGYATIVMDKNSSDRFYNEFVDITEEIKALDLEENARIHVIVDNTKVYNDKLAYIYDAQFWLNRYRIIIGNAAEDFDIREPGVIITSKKTDVYQNAGYEVVYVKKDSEIYGTVTVMQKKTYSELPGQDASGGEIASNGEVASDSEIEGDKTVN